MVHRADPDARARVPAHANARTHALTAVNKVSVRDWIKRCLLALLPSQDFLHPLSPVLRGLLPRSRVLKGSSPSPPRGAKGSSGRGCASILSELK